MKWKGYKRECGKGEKKEGEGYTCQQKANTQNRKKNEEKKEKERWL